MTIKLQLTQNSKHSLIRIQKANHHKGYNVVMMALQNRKTSQTNCPQQNGLKMKWRGCLFTLQPNTIIPRVNDTKMTNGHTFSLHVDVVTANISISTA